MKSEASKVPKQFKAKRDGVMNPQNYNEVIADLIALKTMWAPKDEMHDYTTKIRANKLGLVLVY